MHETCYIFDLSLMHCRCFSYINSKWMWNRRLIREEARRKVRILPQSDSSETSDCNSSTRESDVNLATSDHTNDIRNSQDNSEQTSQHFDEEDSNDDDLEDEDSNEETDDNETFVEMLRNWSLTHSVPHSTLNGLLTIMQNLRKNEVIVPKDARTLLKRRNVIVPELKPMTPGMYVHFGLAAGVTELCNTRNLRNCDLTIDMNIDGVSLFRSSTLEYWVILGAVRDTRDSEFVIGLFQGVGKPSNVDEFLAPLIADLKTLERNELIPAEKGVNVKLGFVCCDRPARSFIKCIKGHNAYYGCDRCTVHGEWLGTVCYLGCNEERRNNETFRQRSQREHHLGVSSFESLRSLDMVNDFPVDFMHCICLGVSLRLLEHLRCGNHPSRLSNSELLRFDDILLSMRDSIPSDFARKPRTIKHLKLWKATELYLFTVYLGFFIIRKLYPSSSIVLKTLLSYFVTVFIICSSHLHESVRDHRHDLVERLLNELLPSAFGRKIMSYNVHAIVHLMEDYDRRGNVHSFSAFRFENFLRFLKKTIRSPSRPLEQTINRIKENGLFLGHLPAEEHLKMELRLSYISGDENRYRILILENTKLKSRSADGYVLTHSGKVVKIQYFLQIKGEYKFEGRAFLSLDSMFVEPVDSKSLCIYKAFNFEQRSSRYDVKDIKMKMMVHRGDYYYCVPVLHTLRPL